MTLTEKLEQLLTRRPNSYVPGYTLLRLLRLPETQLSTASIWRFNMAMHYGQGALAGGIRAMMALYGVRGPFADFMFAGVRLCIDQGLENWMGVGAPPW